MSIKISRKEDNGIIRRNGWLAGTAGSLFLISAGLELIAHRIFGQIDMDTLIWALALGFWAYVLGCTGLLILLGRWLVDWRRVRTSKLEGRELEARPYILEQGLAPAVPGRSSWTCDGGNKTDSRTRVA